MSGKTVETLLAADDARYAALAASDTDTLDRLFTDDYSYTHNAGFTDTKAAYLSRIGSGGVRYSDGHRVTADVRIHGDTGIMTGHMRMLAHLPETTVQLDNIFLAVWLFEEGSWRLAAWSSTTRGD
jgi:hypothetical protein